MPRCAHAQARDTMVHVFVSVICLCIYRLLYSCSMINEMQVSASIVFYSHDFNLWICKMMLYSQV